MKIVVIGAVAAGTSAAAKARRNNENAQISIYERDSYISYSGCGLPYFIGGKTDMASLTPRTSSYFKEKYHIDIFTRHEVLAIQVKEKQVQVKNLETGSVFFDNFDTLIIATGASVFKPTIAGIAQPHVFFLRNVHDALLISSFIERVKPKKAVIAGSGFIGMELAENLTNMNIQVTVAEIANQLTPHLDADMAVYFENILVKKGVSVITGAGIVEIGNATVTLTNGVHLDADMVIMATGVRANTILAQNAGIVTGIGGAIKVNNKMLTNIPGIYACGDCIETFSAVTGAAVYRPLGSTANKTGRIAGDQATGGRLTYRGNLGTGIFKVFNIVIASTGLTEREAQEAGLKTTVCHTIKPNKPEYMGGTEMIIKAVAETQTGRLLGVQIIGDEGVDKRIDVFAALITYKATVDELFYLDLAYAPPFSTTKDPVHYTGMILDNAINGGRALITPNALPALGSDVQIVDARSNDDFANKGHVENAKSIPHATLREKLAQLDKAKPVVTYCNKGVTGNAAQNILLGSGFKRVYNLSGGHTFYRNSKKQN